MVMNLKGPSAAGKSTIRPLQKALAGRIGVPWSEFALISPDIWRKLLLDYGTLGAAYKYGGAFTGEELRIVDQKLDRYMARKAQRGRMSHLLIDRFRFDSFAPDSDEAGSNLLTRFGQIVYLFCLITPPAALVERAWNRGLAVGRYKAVDDTLAHSVEAYSGMPQLFFTWVQRGDKQVHFEFLDNSVRQGEDPRTVAFGWNDVLNVLDIETPARHRAISKGQHRRAGTRGAVRQPGTAGARAQHGVPEGLRRTRFRESNFADRRTGRIYREDALRPGWRGSIRRRSPRRSPDADTRRRICAPWHRRRSRVPSPAPRQPTFLARPNNARPSVAGQTAD